jgi:hypothetical protein
MMVQDNPIFGSPSQLFAPLQGVGGGLIAIAIVTILLFWSKRKV